MKSIICLLFLWSFSTQAQEPAIHFPIKNTRSGQHVYVPGTRLFIVPPKGFTPSGTMSGFEKDDNSAIIVQELIGGSFYSNAATFSRSTFEEKGAKVFDYKETTIGGYHAKYIYAQGDGNARELMLVFGDSTFSTMIIAIYPSGDAATGEQLVAALNTIGYDKNRKIDPSETAIFTLDDKTSRFRFFNYAASMYMYSVGGTDNSADKQAPMVLITQLPKDGRATEKSLAEGMITRAQKYGLSDIKISNAAITTINTLPAYEMTVSGTQNGSTIIYYECAVSKGSKAVILTGILYKDDDQTAREFAALAHSLRFK